MLNRFFTSRTRALIHRPELEFCTEDSISDGQMKLMRRFPS